MLITYAVIASNSIGTTCYTNAVLDDITADTAGNPNQIFDVTVMPVFGPRQDYTFKAGNTYYIFSGFSASNSVDLYPGRPP